MRFLGNDRLDKRPFVLVEKEKGALLITALDSTAAHHRLEVGMTLAEARALLPDIATAAADRQADAEYLLAAAAACEMFTPLVALRGSDGLMLDITGCSHLFGGEERLLTSARRRLREAGLTTRAAIGGTPDASWALARFAQAQSMPCSGGEMHARALPVAALEQGADVTRALTRLGLRTLGDLADRPFNVLTARFGAKLAITLQRILGRDDIRITPLRPPPEIMAEKHFSEPFAAMESLLTVLERLVGDISSILERRAQGGRVFEASFFRADGTVRRLTIETAQASRDVAGLMRLIKLKLDTLADPLDPGFGFDARRLAVIHSEPWQQRQQNLAGQSVADNDVKAVAELVDRLVTRFGRENVRRFIAHDTHDPARAGQTVPYLSDVASTPFPAPEPEQPPLRPLALFAHPQLIEVLAEVPDSPPLRFRWRRVLHEVSRAEGPERIAPEWWQGLPSGGCRPQATRDYYRVEDAAGRRFWIFREGLYEDANDRPRWFLHGLFA
ncbi:MAG: Y-family DNA polymerase [Beijerinckiaceae bacterium]